MPVASIPLSTPGCKRTNRCGFVVPFRFSTRRPLLKTPCGPVLAGLFSPPGSAQTLELEARGQRLLARFSPTDGRNISRRFLGAPGTCRPTEIATRVRRTCQPCPKHGETRGRGHRARRGPRVKIANVRASPTSCCCCFCCFCCLILVFFEGRVSSGASVCEVRDAEGGPLKMTGQPCRRCRRSPLQHDMHPPLTYNSPHSTSTSFRDTRLVSANRLGYRACPPARPSPSCRLSSAGNSRAFARPLALCPLSRLWQPTMVAAKGCI
ncbi:hypothetical protein B0T11DRAFT_119100 [Plectosphaerella cucumerina]|uniref:Uncharacterized protein n=1 Tax=Plectosphaerella cucumerina TaxID=40658 RepID=A0A8K0T7Q9_9PEZI|nr:hypothetical protein B0T11DRAFT_119100 [Plectosphaerella cucumerina]